MIKKYNNVAILRTFSKLFSIAACRLGVITAPKEIIHYAKNAKLTFDANAIALLFAERLLDHPEIEKHLIETEKAGREYTLQTLHDRGYECRDCRGNFIFVKPKNDAHELAKKMEVEHKVLVKTFGHNQLKKYLRISTGSEAAMKKFLEIFFECDK